MSTTVDNYAVNMQFNSSDFESKVSSTINVLEKFKSKLSSLGHDSASTAMNAIGSHVDSLKRGFSEARKSVDDLGEATKNITGNFDAMDIAFATTIANMTVKLEQFAANLAKSLTIEPVKLGFQEYETQIKATQVIKANTGKDVSEINAVLDEMNEYADKTIYNFTQMTDNLGKFTAQGIELEKAKDAIMGMANAAAMFGATPQDLSRATYQMSQALGGTIRMQDWNSLRNANMATAKLKQTIIDTAVEMGVLESSTPDWGALVKGATTFEKSLEAGWLTGDIFVEAMRKFNDTTTALGIEAQEAATHAKTFTQLRDATMEAVQSGWTRVFRTIIGDLDQAEEFWSKINESLNGEHGIITAYSDAIGSTFEEWAANGGREKAIEALSDAFHGLLDVIIPVKDAFFEFFPTLDGDKLLEFTDKVAESASKFHDFGAKFRSYFGEFVEKYDKQVKKWSETVTTTEEVSPSMDAMDDALQKAVMSNGQYSRIVNSYLSMLRGSDFRDKDGNLVESKIRSYLQKENFSVFDRFLDSNGGTYKNSKSIIDLIVGQVMGSDDYQNKYYANSVKSQSHFNTDQMNQDVYQMWRAVLAQNGIDVDEQLSTIQESLKTYQQVSKEVWHVEEETKALIAPASDVNERVTGTALAAKNLYTIVKGIPGIINGIKDALGGFYERLIKPIASNMFGNALQTVLQITARIVTDVSTIVSLIKNFGIVDKVFDSLYNFFNRNFDIAGWFQTFYNTFINFRVTIKGLIEDIATFFGFFDNSQLITRIRAVGTVIFQQLRDILGNNIMTGGLMGSITGALSGAFTGFFSKDKVTKRFGGIGGAIKGAIQGIFSGGLNGVKLGGLLGILNTISKVNVNSSGIIGLIQNIGNKIGDLIEKIRGLSFEEFITKAKNALDSFFGMITQLGLNENGEFSLITFAKNFFKLGTAAIEAFINGFLGKKKEVQEHVKNLFDYISEFVKMAFDSFKNSGFGQYIIGTVMTVKNVISGLFGILTGLISVGLILIEDVLFPLWANLNNLISHTLPDGETVGNKLGEAFTWLATTALPAVASAIGFVIDGISSFVEWIIQAKEDINEFFDTYKKNNPDSLLTKFLDLLSSLKEKASSAFGVLKKEGVSGIKSLWDAFKMTDVGKNLLAIIDIVKGFGSAIRQGFLGIDESTDELKSSFGFKNIDSSSITSFLSSVSAAIQAFPTSEAFDRMKSALIVFGAGARNLWDALGTLMNGAIIPFFNFLKENLPGAVLAVYDFLIDKWRAMSEFFVDLSKSDFSLEKVFTNIIGDPIGAISKVLGKATYGIGKVAGLIFNGLSGAIGGHEAHADDLTNETIYAMTSTDRTQLEKLVSEYQTVAKEAGIAQNEINQTVAAFRTGIPTYDSNDNLLSTVYETGRLLKIIDDVKSGASNVVEAVTTSSATVATSVKQAEDVDADALLQFVNTLKEKLGQAGEIVGPGFESFKGTLEKLASNEGMRKLALGAFGMLVIKQVTNRATKGWTKAFKTVSEQVGTDGKEAAKTLGEALKGSATSVKEGLSGIFGPFEEIGKIIGKSFELITGAFTSINKLSESIAKANRAEAFKDYSTGILMLAAAFSAVALVVDHIGLDKWKVLATAFGIIAGLLVVGYGVMALIEKFGKAAQAAVKPFQEAPSSMRGVLHSFLTDLGESLKNFLKQVGTKEILIGIAVAMGTLTASLIALSFIPAPNLIKAGIALAGVAVGLRALMKASSSGNSIGNGAGILLIAVAIATLIKSMKKIAALDPGAILGSIGTIGALMFEIWAFLKATKGNSNNAAQNAKTMLSTAVAMAAIGIGIKSMASAVKKLGNLDLATLGKGLVSVGVLLTEMSLFVKYTKNAEMYRKTATAMVLMSGALNVMSVAVRNFGSIDFPVLVQGLGSVAALMFAISKFMNNMNGVQVPIKSSIAMLALAGAINMLDDAVKKLGSIDFWSLIKGVGSVMLLMASVSEAVNTMEGEPVKFRSMLASAILIVEMYATLGLIKQYGEIDLGPLLKGVLSFIAVIWAISGATKMLGDYKGGIIKPFIMMAGLLAGVVGVLYFLSDSQLDSERFLQFAEGISMCIVSIGIIAGILTAVHANLASGVSAGLGFIGFVGTIAGITTAVIAVAGIINEVVKSVTQYFGLGENGEGIDVLEWLGGYIEKFVGFLGRLGGTLAGSGIDAFTAAIGDGHGLTSLGEALEIFGGSIETFKDSLVTLKDLGSEEIASGIGSFCEAITAITGSELRDAVSDLIHSWIVGDDENSTNALSDFGTDLAGFGKGASEFSTFIMSVNNGIKGKADAIAGVLETLTGVVPKSGSILEVITGGQDFEEFGGKFAAFGEKIKEFSDNVGTLDNESALTAVGPLITSISGLIDNVYAFDPSLFDDLSTSLPTLGTALGTFASSINSIDEAKGAAAVSIVQQIVDLEAAVTDFDTEQIAGVTTFLDTFEGFSGSFTKFMTNLSGAVSNVQEISIVDSKGDIKKKFADTSEVLTLALKPIKSIQNLIKKFKEISEDKTTLVEWFTGDTTLSNLGTELNTFGTNYSAFLTTVADLNKDLQSSEYNSSLDELFGLVERVVESLSKFDSLPAQTTLWESIFGKEDKTLGTFGRNLASFGESLRMFVQSLMQSDENAASLNDLLAKEGSKENLTTLIEKAKDIITSFNGVEIPNQGSFLSKIISQDTSLATFGDGLATFGTGLKAFCNAASEITDIGIIDTALEGVGKIFTFFKDNGINRNDVDASKLLDDSVSFLSAFTYQLQEMIGVNADATSDDGPLKPIYDVFTEAGTKAIEKFSSGLEGDNKYTLHNAAQTVVDLANADIMSYVDETMNDVGEYYVEGFAIGIRNYLDNVKAASTELGAAALEALNNVLGIASPSEEGEDSGEFFSLGDEIGTRNGIPGVEKAAEDLGQAALDSLSDTVSTSADVGKKTADDFIDSVSESIDAAEETIKGSGLLNTAKEAGSAVAGKVGEIKESVTNVATDVGNAVAEAISPLTDAISSKFDQITSIFQPNGVFFQNISKAWADPQGMLDEMTKSVDSMVNGFGGIEDYAFGHDSIFAGIDSEADSFLKQFSDLGEKLGMELGTNSGDAIADGMAEGLDDGATKVYDSIDQMAWRVISGEFGNGQDRINALESIGLSYGVIQNRVNELLGCNFRYATSNEDLTRTLTTLGETAEETAETATDSLKVLTDGMTGDDVTEALRFLSKYTDKYKELAEEVYGKPYDQLIEEGIIKDARTFQNAVDDAFMSGDSKEKISEKISSVLLDALGIDDEASDEAKKLMNSLKKDITDTAIELHEKVMGIVSRQTPESEAEQYLIDQINESGGKITSALYQYADSLDSAEEYVATSVAESLNSMYDRGDYEGIFTTLEETAAHVKELISEGNIDEAYDELASAQKTLDQFAYNKSLNLNSAVVRNGEDALNKIQLLKDAYAVLKDLQDESVIVMGGDDSMAVKKKADDFTRDLKKTIASLVGEIDDKYAKADFKTNINRALKAIDNNNVDAAMQLLETVYETLEKAVDNESQKMTHAGEYLEKAYMAFATGDFDKAGQLISTASNAMVQDIGLARDELYGAVIVFDDGFNASFDELSRLRKQIDSAIEDGDLSVALAVAKRYNDALQEELERNKVDLRSDTEKFADKYKRQFEISAQEIRGWMAEGNTEMLEKAFEAFEYYYIDEFIGKYGDQYKESAEYLRQAFEGIQKDNDWEGAADLLMMASKNMAEVSTNAANEYRSAGDELAAAYEENAAGNTEAVEERLKAALADMDEKKQQLDAYKSTMTDVSGTVEEQAVSSSEAVAKSTDEVVTDVKDASQQTSEAVKTAGNDIKTEVDSTVNETLSSLENAVPEFESAGGNLAVGLANGYVEKIRSESIAKMNEANQEVINATRAKFDENSPSKVFKQIGSYCGEGLYVGVDSWHDRIQNAMLRTADGMITGAQYALRMAKLATDESLDIKPTIAPVVDMTNINQSDIAAKVFGKRPMIEFGDFNIRGIDKVRNIADAMAEFSNDNSDVVEAIHTMRGDITSLGSSIEKMQIVMDSGRLVGQISGDMNRSLGRASKLRGRGVY